MAEETESSAEALPEEPAERVRAMLERIVEDLDLEASVSVEEDEDEIRASVDGEDVGLLIGRHGQTIDAVQLLCYQAAFQGRPERKRVTVDAAEYRERQGETLRRQADLGGRGRAPRRPRDRDGVDGLERAPRRPRAPARPHRGRDLQRGRRAQPLRGRRAAALGLTLDAGDRAQAARRSPTCCDGTRRAPVSTASLSTPSRSTSPTRSAGSSSSS